MRGAARIAACYFASWKITPNVCRRPERTAHAVPEVHAVGAPRALDGTVVDGERSAVAPAGGTTSTRDCMRGRCSVSTGSPPVKSVPGSASRNATWNGKRARRTVLVQAVVIVGPCEAGGASGRFCSAMWHLEMNSACVPGCAHRHASPRSICWRAERALDNVVRNSAELGQQVAEYLCSAEPVARHHDVAPEQTAIVVKAGNRPTLVGQNTTDDNPAVTVEIG